MPVVIQRAVPADAAALSDLARRIYIDTFAATDKPEDQAAFLAATYTEERQRREIEDGAMVTLLVYCDDVLTGYAQLRRGREPESIRGDAPLEIMRFYVEKSFHGAGVAQRLMEEIERHARDTGVDTLWLGVWERNERAKRFYAKLGFKVVGTKPFVVGSDVQTDLVLARPLTDE